MNRTRTLLVIGVFMLSLAVLAALEFRVQDEAPTEGQMVTGSLSKDVPALPKLPSLTDSDGKGVLVPLDNGTLRDGGSPLDVTAPAPAEPVPPAAPAAPVLPEGQGPEKSKYVREALTYLSEHYNDPDISVSSVARCLGVSDGHLSHVFKKETSYTLSAYLTNYRMHKATELLRDCRVKVYEVAESVGYRDITYFSSAFKKSVGMSPSEYQKRCQ